MAVTFGVTVSENFKGFQEGRYSIAWAMGDSETEALLRNPEYAACYREGTVLSTMFLALNAHRGALASAEARHRVVNALDIDQFVRRAIKSRHATPASGLIPPGLLGYEPRRERAGGPRSCGGLTDLVFTLAMPPGWQERSTAQTLMAVMQEGGLQLTQLHLSWSELDEVRQSGDVDLILCGWTADYPDADSFAYGLLHSSAGMFGRFCGDPEVDRLIESARNTTDPALRHEIYCEMEEEIARRALLLPLFHPMNTCFANPAIEGLELNFFLPAVSYEKIQFR
jgi:peptide/nickel transport system substrate-binding protein